MKTGMRLNAQFTNILYKACLENSSILNQLVEALLFSLTTKPEAEHLVLSSFSSKGVYLQCKGKIQALSFLSTCPNEDQISSCPALGIYKNCITATLLQSACCLRPDLWGQMLGYLFVNQGIRHLELAQHNATWVFKLPFVFTRA